MVSEVKKIRMYILDVIMISLKINFCVYDTCADTFGNCILYVRFKILLFKIRVINKNKMIFLLFPLYSLRKTNIYGLQSLE